MSPQFVDFDADGHLDMVAGIFDGSPHVAFGTAQGWRQPESILDRDGARIVIHDFWNFDTKQWDTTTRCDPQGEELPRGHLTSAWATDWDGDGDLDLLLGDHKAGLVCLRINEGTATAPAFATRNQALRIGGELLRVPGTVTTLRLVDWDGDGLEDLLIGSMGDAYGDAAGGGVFVHRNTGAPGKPEFGPAITLIAASAKGAAEPTRPDSGLYMDVIDHDGDGDLDLLVGGYSHWTPAVPELSDDQQERVATLRTELEKLGDAQQAIFKRIEDAIVGLDEAAADARRTELLAAVRPELTAHAKRRAELDAQLDPLVPGKKRVSYVWLYENLRVRRDGQR